MKVLLDACVWCGVAPELRAAGHDVIWAGDWPSDPGDEEILARACQEGRVLVTLDKDFGELAVAKGLPHAGILRMVGFSSRQQVFVCLNVLLLHASELSSGALITAEPGRLRVRLH